MGHGRVTLTLPSARLGPRSHLPAGTSDPGPLARGTSLCYPLPGGAWWARVPREAPPILTPPTSQPAPSQLRLPLCPLHVGRGLVG